MERFNLFIQVLRKSRLKTRGIFAGILLSFSWQIGCAQSGISQDSFLLPKIQHEVGVSAGLTIGSGFLYRIWIGKFGAMVTAAPSWIEYRESYLAGFSLYLVGFQNHNSKFFFYQGNHFMSSNLYRGYYGWSSTNGVVSNYDPAETIKDRNWNHGIGVGYEIFRGPGRFNPFGLCMMVGWAGYKNFTETNITGELALVYKFSKNGHLQPQRAKRVSGIPAMQE